MGHSSASHVAIVLTLALAIDIIHEVLYSQHTQKYIVSILRQGLSFLGGTPVSPQHPHRSFVVF